MKKMFTMVGALSLCMFGIMSDADAATTITQGQNLGSEDQYACSDSAHSFRNTASHQTGSFTLPPGVWQPFLGGTTTWRIEGFGSTQYSGFVEIDIVNVGTFGAQTVVSSFIRSFDSTGTFGALPDDQDLGSFTSAPANVGGGTYFIRAIAAADCGRGYGSASHVFNTNINFVSF